MDPKAESHEARYYIDTPRGIKCLLCPNECLLQEGQPGLCNTRVVREGKLYTLAYGNPCAIHVDPVEKKPLLHFYPASLAFSLATAGCNFACLNCQNAEISQASPLQTRNYLASPDNIVNQALRGSCKSIAYTYTEPTTWFEFMFDTATLARRSGLKNIMISNGYINPEPLHELCSVIDAANIDLKTMDPTMHLKLTGGNLNPVLETLKTIRDKGLWLEITNLLVPTRTDDPETITRMCEWLVREGFDKFPLHFSRFHPTHKLPHLPVTPLQTLTRAKEIAIKSGMRYVYIGNVAGIGGEDTYCHSCRVLLIKRQGFETEQNQIISGRCPKCQTTIPGRF